VAQVPHLLAECFVLVHRYTFFRRANSTPSSFTSTQNRGRVTLRRSPPSIPPALPAACSVPAAFSSSRFPRGRRSPRQSPRKSIRHFAAAGILPVPRDEAV